MRRIKKIRFRTRFPGIAATPGRRETPLLERR